ncbi:MAG: Uma2 family endonuclease [Synechococcales bacterium]|nr:Uma2 family endonuclease [Synechococcales bacterium]
MQADPVILQEWVPPLESGDRLTRHEFERRYRAMPQVKKAELVEGVVYVASPVRMMRHARPHGRVITWLGTYEAATPGVMVGDNPTVRLDLDNEPQPDALLRIEEACGGRSRITADDYVEGAPELIVEVAASSASYDLHDKLTAYRRNGVEEYLVWLVMEGEFRWYELREGAYYLQSAITGEAVYKSRVMPGLWLDTNALLAGEMAQVLAVLQQGIDSQEHQDFVRRLRNLAEGTA